MGKEYFHGLTADEYDQRVNARLGDPEGLRTPQARAQRAAWRERAMIWLCRIGLLAFVLSLPWGLSSCAMVPEEEVVAKVCYMRYMGKSEEGYTVVVQACQSPESFAESQK